MKPGAVFLSSEITNLRGDTLKANKNTHLVSIFLGTVRDGVDPDPARRMHNLGWRQMAFYEASIHVVANGNEDITWRLVYACLGAVDAVEAGVRFANKMIAERLEEDAPGTAAPYLGSLFVGTMKIGPIGDDGTPFNGRGPAYFGWKNDLGISLDDHIEKLRQEAKNHAQ